LRVISMSERERELRRKQHEAMTYPYGQPEARFRRYSFTREELIEALTRLEAYPATLKSGRVILIADSMADALIEALEDIHAT
jgi:hypothetical protein